MKKLLDNKDFRIFIPTHNRTEYLKRILTYYNSYKKEFNVTIADSSSKESKEINKKIIPLFKNLKIEHLADYPTDINPHIKFAKMIQNYTEKYCVFCADDDFVSPNGIVKSMNFLEENKDFICAHGDYFSFDKNNNHFYWKKIYPGLSSITYTNPIDRLIKHIEDYYQVLYAVHRTEERIEIYKELLKSKADPMQFGEILPDQVSILYGKMKKLDELYMVRQNDSRVAYWPSLLEYMEKGLYKKEFKKFEENLSGNLSKIADMDYEDAVKIINDSWQIYLNILFKKETNSKPISTRINEILNRLGLPDGIDRPIKDYSNKIILHLLKNIIWNQNIPNTEYYKDLKIIRTLVLENKKSQNDNLHENDLGERSA